MIPIRRLRQLYDARGPSPVIEVDGGQNCAAIRAAHLSPARKARA